MMIDQRDAAFAGGGNTAMFAGDGQIGQLAIQRFADQCHRLQLLVAIHAGQ